MKKPNPNINKIIQMYTSEKYFTKDIAKKFKLSSRQIYTILKQNNMSLSVQEGLKKSSKIKKTSPVEQYNRFIGKDTRAFFICTPRAIFCHYCKKENLKYRDKQAFFLSDRHYDFSPNNLVLVCTKCLIDKLSK
jgi:hypothetical protein